MYSPKNWVALLCAVFFGLASPAAAQLDRHLGPLADTVPLGVNGPWEAKLQDGWFNFFNQTEAGAVLYYHVTQIPVEQGERVLNANVMLLSESDAYVGLIVNKQADDQYIAFTIKEDGTAVKFTRTPSGFQQEASTVARARLDGSDILTMRQSPTSIDLLLNDVSVFQLTNQAGFEPTFGIIAIGTGRFAYNGLTIEQIAAANPFPTPGGTQNDPKPKFPGPVADGTGGAPQPEQPGTTGGNPFEGMSQEDIYASQIMLGTTLGIFFHELGHAVIGETNLPATGPEEDTADGFSAFVLASLVEEGDFDSPEEELFVQKLAEFASLYWFYSGVRNEQSGQKNPWQDEHSPDIKRFRNSFCILFGSNPSRYEAIAAKVQLDARTRERCKGEYAKRLQAWETILKTVSRDLGPDSPGDHPANTPGGKIHVSFQPSQGQVGGFIAAVLGDGTLREIMVELENEIVWPRDLQIEFRDCQEINAWYDPRAGKVTMCYSIVEFASKTILEAETGQGQPGPNQGGGSDAVSFMTGVWQASFPSQYGMIHMKVAYDNNGQYESYAETSVGPVQVVGTWQAQVSGQSGIVVAVNPTQWSPQMLCDQSNNCQPHQQSPMQFNVQVVDERTVNVEGINWSRVQ
ncbi:hypothetical protein NBRC116601_01730 [Cognatishimia sp. WU-CL00825]|uniref:DUF4344 domain-containing metallopeptidase n=1 Tax=Cognatishimia sp. WU-CL00825 TaxID=3127658 RepID=UPI003102CF0D